MKTTPFGLGVSDIRRSRLFERSLPLQTTVNCQLSAVNRQPIKNTTFAPVKNLQNILELYRDADVPAATDMMRVLPDLPADYKRRRRYQRHVRVRDELMAHYRSFRFAFPERQNELIEQAEEVQRQALLKSLAGKEAYLVYHPYPVAIPALYDAMESYV